MTTIENIDLSGSALQAAGFYETAAIALTDEAFLSIQVVMGATLPNAKLRVIPVISNGLDFFAVKSMPHMPEGQRFDGYGTVQFEVEPIDEATRLANNQTNLFLTEPVRGTNAKIRIPLDGITQGIISLYIKTTMEE